MQYAAAIHKVPGTKFELANLMNKEIRIGDVIYPACPSDLNIELYNSIREHDNGIEIDGLWAQRRPIYDLGPESTAILEKFCKMEWVSLILVDVRVWKAVSQLRNRTQHFADAYRKVNTPDHYINPDTYDFVFYWD